MINYNRCSEVKIEQIYEAFNIGFSDYIVKLNMGLEDFIKRFFGPEGNSLENSFIALDGDKAIGLVLGGIKEYQGIKTIRCGTLTVAPDYRGQGVSYKLFELYKEEGIKNNCKQLFLEVIVGNDRAIKFYEKNGFYKVYDMWYYGLTDIENIKSYDLGNIVLKESNIDTLNRIFKEKVDCHINWQNDIDFIRGLENNIIYGAYEEDKVVSLICITPMGRVNFLWTDKEFRNRGLAMSLIKEVYLKNQIKKVSLCFPNNSLAYGFALSNGFKKEGLSQYEMYYIL